MDFNDLFIGLGCFLFSFLIYIFFLKNETVATKETNWEGVPLPNYIGLWGTIVLLVICGIAFLFKAL